MLKRIRIGCGSYRTTSESASSEMLRPKSNASVIGGSFGCSFRYCIFRLIRSFLHMLHRCWESIARFWFGFSLPIDDVIIEIYE